MSMIQCRAAAPVAPWLGGKRQLSDLIISKIDVIPHRTYAEPFVGMGGVFLRRSSRPKVEVANDLNGEIINLFRILQRHYPQFIEVMRFQITSRAEFDRLRGSDPSTLTDLERAARFLYLQRLSFGGKPGGVFGVDPTSSGRFNVSRLGPILEAAHDRLAGVILESLDWQNFMSRYDSEDTLFYLDPPYLGGETDYGKDIFDREDFSVMAAALRDIKGQFILSINDHPEVRSTFEGFHFEEVQVSYSVARQRGPDQAKHRRSSELLVSREPINTGLFGSA